MIRKQVQFEEAQRLRKRGFTYTEIAKITSVSVSTVSAWFSKEAWSQQVRDDNQLKAARENRKRISLLNKARVNQYAKLYAEAERSAVNEYKHYRTNPLFIAGLMVYLGEGDNVHSRLIRITNSRMQIHRIFIAFLLEFLGVPREKIHFWLLLYPELQPIECMKVWSETLGISPTQFYKYQVIEGRSKKRRLQYGVGNTIIGSAVLKKKLMKWMELALKELK